MRSTANRPFPSSPGPLFQNEGRCSAFEKEIIFHSHANKTHFHKKGCAHGLILKAGVFGTRKWPIDSVPPWYSPAQPKSHSMRARICRPTGIFPCLRNIMKLGQKEWT